MNCVKPKCHETKKGKCVKPNSWTIFRSEFKGSGLKMPELKKEYVGWKGNLGKDADEINTTLCKKSSERQKKTISEAKRVIKSNKENAKRQINKASKKNDAIALQASEERLSELRNLSENVCDLTKRDIIPVVYDYIEDVNTGKISTCQAIDKQYRLKSTNVYSLLASTPTAIVYNSITDKDLTVVKLIPMNPPNPIKINNKIMETTYPSFVGYGFDVHKKIVRRVGNNNSIVIIAKPLSFTQSNGVASIVSERVIGQTIGDALSKSSARDRVTAAIMYGQSLRFMHDKGIIHGDYHGSNAMLSTSSGSLKVHPIDFDRSVIFSSKSPKFELGVKHDIFHAIFSLNTMRNPKQLYTAFRMGYNADQDDGETFAGMSLGFPLSDLLDEDKLHDIRVSTFIEYSKVVWVEAVKKFIDERKSKA